MIGINELVLLSLLFLLASALYASVGHGGASAYLAVMALFSISPSLMKPTALMLNVLVAGIATAKFARAGFFSWPLFWPFAVTSIPCAYAGGMMRLADPHYKMVVGVVLLFAAYRIFEFTRRSAPPAGRPVPQPVAMGMGILIGFISGLVGVGGGIFLSPVLLMMGWADAHRTSALSAAFIFANSIAGLCGHFLHQPMPSDFSMRQFAVWAGAVIVGGWIGSELGSRRFKTLTLRRLLAVVLVIAGIKLILTR